jgi:cytochrome b561
VRSITPVERGARYNPLAVFLHWVTAALILLNWLLPQITDLIARSNVPRVIALHRSIGVTVLALVLLRAAWRLISPPPGLPSGTAQVLRIASHIGHAALYLLMVAVPVFGILFTWAGGHVLSVWGTVEIAAPSWIDPDLRDTFREAHEICANAILWLVGLHVAAALIHHYVFKDGLLDRMLPARFRTGRSRPSALI